MDTAALSQAADRSKSIEELEEVAWPAATLSSYVARTAAALRRRPLRDLTDEQIRVGLEQHVGVEYLAPLAVERLRADPLIEARLYRGDLLLSLLDLPAEYWCGHPEVRRAAADIAATALDAAPDCPGSWRTEILPGLHEPHDRFTGKLASRTWLRPDEGRAPPARSRAVRRA